MNKFFVDDAMNRIAAVAQIPRTDGEVASAVDLLRQIVDAESGAGYDDVLAERAVTFVELIELGVRAGYVALGEWEGAEALQKFFSQWIDNPAELDETVSRLIRALIRRFEQPAWSSQPLDDETFASFESYLHLTSRVKADAAAAAFLDEIPDSGLVDRDRPALLSPHHFAEAYTTGAIAGVSVSNVAACVSVLGYFQWLAEILDSLGPDSPLREGILYQARWAHRAARVKRRLGSWVDRMREWNEVQVQAGTEGKWQETVERLFDRLAAEQERWAVGIETRQAESLPGEFQFQELLAEGRVKAVGQVLLADTEKSYQHVILHLGRDNLENFVKRCQLLADYGNFDAAAAFVALIIPELIKLPVSEEVLGDARAILARAREGGLEGEKQKTVVESRVEATPREAESLRDTRSSVALARFGTLEPLS